MQLAQAFRSLPRPLAAKPSHPPSSFNNYFTMLSHLNRRSVHKSLLMNFTKEDGPVGIRTRDLLRAREAFYH